MPCLIRTKACRRCGGDLSLERDRYGTYLECIQCGAVWNEPDLIKLKTQEIKARSLLEKTNAVLLVNNNYFMKRQGYGGQASFHQPRLHAQPSINRASHKKRPLASPAKTPISAGCSPSSIV